MAGFTAADLFCGAGGAARGIHDADFDLVGGVDQNATALQSYNESLPCDPVRHDLRCVDPSVLPTAEIDYLHGSPPCQGFSQAGGTRDVTDDRNELVWRFVEWVDAVRPAVVTMENVAGMQTISTGFVDRLLGDGRPGGQQATLDGGVANDLDATVGFGSIGYRAKARVLNAADYGVPQTRRRLFVVAVREDLPTPDRWFPAPTHRPDEWRTVREAIDDIADELDDTSPGIVYAQNAGHVYSGDLDLSEVGDPAKTIHTRAPLLANHEPQDHQQTTRERLADLQPGTTAGSVNESRLAADEPACTITSGNGTPPAHYQGPTPRDTGDRIETIRRLTVRECARLQSFPDDHYFVGGKEAQYRQVGNAVPPLLQQRLAEHLRDYLNGGE